MADEEMANGRMANGEFFNPDVTIKAKQCLITNIEYSASAIRHFFIRHL